MEHRGLSKRRCR